MALTPARVVARLLANVEQAGGCVVTPEAALIAWWHWKHEARR